jgi:hypothetical protein
MSYFPIVPCLTLQIGGCRWVQPVDEIDRLAPREGNCLLNAIERFLLTIGILDQPAKFT